MKLSDLSSPAFIANPYPMYEELRAAGPFVQMGPRTMLTGRYAVTEAMLLDRRLGKDFNKSIRARYGEAATNERSFQAMARTFLMLNPPSHTRLRDPLTQAFNARQIEKLRDLSVDSAHRLIDAFPSGGNIDLIRDFAAPLPVRIICGLLDIPLENADMLRRATGPLTSTLDIAPLDADRLHAAKEATRVLQDYFSAMVNERRANPGDDLISKLATLSDESEPLTNDEIVSNVILLFAAGHETTSNMIGNALVSLHRNPAQLEKLKNNPSLMPKAVAECIRYDGSVQMVTRVVSEDVEIAGVKLARDTALFASIGAANRDPARFDDPDTLDIERDDHGRLLSFGGGIHYCLGARLALLELETSLAALFERAPNLRLRNLDDLHWNNRSSIRGVQSLVASRE
ncbi:putative cytochrome P450 hydroxylase [Caballeronia glathei]|uniref:Cytochrome P450 n=1 Tax=Caballeronia glathei TaxID=60547 RepID=A0A069PV09_9BURK|nr:cytochrome P450 [Caballeronia glathei]KDR44292.1 cytochrome P450 [Caballeronia glathei]CDY77578.1 putative cytochrome P450 hydroxylase [Caballeronia glathei]